MPHHFTKSTTDISRWCNRCNRMTQWYVSDGRLGRCKEDHQNKKPKKVKPEDKQENLFR